MNNASQPDRQKQATLRAFGLAALVAFITAGVVSWVTPDGNLVVTLVPAVVVGELVYYGALWWSRRGRSK